MSFVPSKLYCDSFFPNTETSLTMGNGHTQFPRLSDMTYSWVVDTSNNLTLNGQSSGPSPAIQPIIVSSNGVVSIPSFDVSGVSSSTLVGNPNATINATSGVVYINTPTTQVSGSLDVSQNITASNNIGCNGLYNSGSNATYFFNDKTNSSRYYNLYGIDNRVHLQTNGTTDIFTVDSNGNSNVVNNLVVGGSISAGSGLVSSVSAGTGISITGTASAPVINATGGGGGPTVDAVPAGTKSITIPAGNSIFNYTFSAGGGGGGGGAFAGSGSNSSGGGGGGGGQLITGSIYCTSGNTFIQYSLGSGGAGGVGGNPNGANGADGADSTLQVNGSINTITAKGGKGGKGGNSGVGGNGGDGFYSGGGGQGLTSNGLAGVGSLVSGTDATDLQNGQGGNNPFPAYQNRIVAPNPSTNVLGGIGGATGGAFASGSTLVLPPQGSFGGGGAGGNSFYPNGSTSNGSKGGDGYISYYFTPL